jgi:hypothetical protein
MAHDLLILLAINRTATRADWGYRGATDRNRWGSWRPITSCIARCRDDHEGMAKTQFCVKPKDARRALADLWTEWDSGN